MRNLIGWFAASTVVILAGCFVWLCLFSDAAQVIGQTPGEGKKEKKKDSQSPPDEAKPPKVKPPPGPIDEEKEILKEIKEAYKAQYEVPEDILKELRKGYKEPTPKREAEILKEVRRLYVPTPDQETAILDEIQRAFEQRTPDQEERVFAAIRRSDPLPIGAVNPSTQTNQAARIFQRLDRDGDGVLSPDEMPDPLRAEQSRWDRNGNGVIEQSEYWAYYRSRLEGLSILVESGDIDLGLKRGKAEVIPGPMNPQEPRQNTPRHDPSQPGLPSWFNQLDTNRDGQVAMSEWLNSGRSLDDFIRLDLNRDGFITKAEMQRHFDQQARVQAEYEAQIDTLRVIAPDLESDRPGSYRDPRAIVKKSGP